MASAISEATIGCDLMTSLNCPAACYTCPAAWLYRLCAWVLLSPGTLPTCSCTRPPNSRAVPSTRSFIISLLINRNRNARPRGWLQGMNRVCPGAAASKLSAERSVRLCVLQDHRGGLFADHDRRGVGVAGDDHR